MRSCVNNKRSLGILARVAAMSYSTKNAQVTKNSRKICDELVEETHLSNFYIPMLFSKDSFYDYYTPLLIPH